MDRIQLVEVSAEYAESIENYRAEFPAGGMRVTCNPRRILGLDGLEDFGSVEAWLGFCESMRGKITWCLSIRESDGRAVGACCLRHKLAYDDEDGEFASHIGNSICPSERQKGYAKERLRLILGVAREMGHSPGSNHLRGHQCRQPPDDSRQRRRIRRVRPRRGIWPDGGAI